MKKLTEIYDVDEKRRGKSKAGFVRPTLKQFFKNNNFYTEIEKQTDLTGELFKTLDNPNAYGTSAVDDFGYSVSISESYSIVGAHYEGDAGGTTSGKAYIYK